VTSVGLRCVFLPAAILLLQSGCAQQMRARSYSSGVSGSYDNPRTWLQVAKRHEVEGDLQQALIEYRLAKTVGGENWTIREHLRRVEKQIDDRCSSLLEKADRIAARGKTRAASLLYLKILGLRPDHSEALAALRKQDQRLALRAMEKKRALARRTPRSGRTTGQYKSASVDEGYTNSRQSILEADHRPADDVKLPQELERQIEKYPQDDALRHQLVETGLIQAEKAYQARRLDDALVYLSRAKQASKGDAGGRQSIAKAHKRYARELYKEGVISFRSDPQKALSCWRYALKFDPQDKKSRLRIRSMTQE
jgi:hypothetical protein